MCLREKPPWRSDCLETLLSEWPSNRSSSLSSTGWVLLVDNILWHLPPLGKVRPQLLHRTSRKQLAHGAGTQRFLHPGRPEWHTIGRQRSHYKRMYLGILGKAEPRRIRKAGAEALRGLEAGEEASDAEPRCRSARCCRSGGTEDQQGRHRLISRS